MAALKAKCHPEYSCYSADFILDGASFCFVARCGAARCGKPQGVVGADNYTRVLGQDAEDIMRLASMGCHQGVRNASGRIVSAFGASRAVQPPKTAPKTFVEASAGPEDEDGVPF